MANLYIIRIEGSFAGQGWWLRTSVDPELFEPIVGWFTVIAASDPESVEIEDCARYVIPLTVSEVREMNFSGGLGMRWEFSSSIPSREVFHESDFHVLGEVLKQYSSPR